MATGNGDRRTFLLSILYSLWAGIAAALSIPAAVYLFLPPNPRKENDWAEAGDVTRMVPNSPVEMVFRRNRIDGWRIQSEKSTAWAVKLDSGEVVAFAPQCTHLGCAYHWEDNKRQFVCPCHSSVFSSDGTVVSGPAQRPLDRFEAKVERNKLLVGAVRQAKETRG